MQERTCPICGEPVPANGKSGAQPKYCSKECRAAVERRRKGVQTRQGTCTECGATYEQVVRQGSRSKFTCSPACANDRINRLDRGNYVKRSFRGSASCQLEGCDRPHYSNGWCSLHYGRLRRDGEVGPVGTKKRANGSRYIDPKTGYVYIHAGQRRRRLEHRVVMEGLLGRELLPGETVHHVNGDRSDNTTNGPLINFRSGNLELWSSMQPAGQRVQDKVAYAIEILMLYRPDFLKILDEQPLGDMIGWLVEYFPDEMRRAQARHDSSIPPD